MPYYQSTWNVCKNPTQECKSRAMEGDIEAAITLYKHYYNYGNDLEGLRWQMMAGRLGDLNSLDELIYKFSPSGIYNNESKLKEFIDIGTKYNHTKSIIAKAAYFQDIDPPLAKNLYLVAAKEDDCFAQIMLAASYRDGIFTEVNEAKALFWFLLSNRFRGIGKYNVGEIAPYLPQRLREAVNINVSQYATNSYAICSTAGYSSSGLRRLEKGSYTQEVKNLMLQWHIGQDAPEQLDRFHNKGTTIDTITPPVDQSVVGQEVSSLKSKTTWKREVIAEIMTLTKDLPKEDLYDQLTKSVYVVIAAPSQKALRLKNNIAQASGVAIDRSTIITNSHIIENRPEVFVVVSGHLVRASVNVADLKRDLCILKISDHNLSPVAGIKGSRSLRVGEDVLAIGSPHGFTNSLSMGLVSQLRLRDGVSVIQTTAQISRGSSGGGLFDRYGNLIGITTFKIKEAEGLNFAITIDEFIDIP